MIRNDVAVFERKHVQRSQKLLPPEDEWYREAALRPGLDERDETSQVVEGEAFHQRESVHRSIVAVRAHTVRDHGVEPGSKHALEIGDERVERCAMPGRQRERCSHQAIILSGSMQLRTLNVGCFGGGTGLPSLIGGLKTNPWLVVHAIVTMFDSGGSSGQLRDELGVLPPGDVLRCALALARNEREARNVLLARLHLPEQHARLRGHTGGNLLLSMMEQYSGDFLAAVDGLRALLGCEGHVWPISTESASICAEYGDGSATRGEVEVDAGQTAGNAITRLWLEPHVHLHRATHDAIQALDAVVIGPGSFYTSLMPILLVQGAPEAIRQVKGPIVLVTNLLTEGRGMWGFTAGEAVRKMSDVIGRPVDVVIVNTSSPSTQTLSRYLTEHKRPLEFGNMPAGCEVVEGGFWSDEIARHDRRRLAHAVWAVLAKRLL